MNHVANKQKGFTLIELMLAMTFLSMLLLVIALTIVQVGALYNKGITLKEVNQTSRDVTDDLRRTIGASNGLDATTDYVTTSAGGRLCLGSVSYVWNYEKALSLADPAAKDPNVAEYDGAPAEASPVRLVKVPDPGRVYCAKLGTALENKNIRAIDVDKAQELLRPGERGLSIHEFTLVTPVPESATNSLTGSQLYSLTFTIGTKKISALNADQTSCLPPNDINSDPLYCNVQKFSLVVRTI